MNRGLKAVKNLLRAEDNHIRELGGELSYHGPAFRPIVSR